MDTSAIEYEFLRPMCSAWLKKISAGIESRSRWKEVADECLMFFGHSASAMWDPSYGKKFWKNVKLPKFRITINKAFEYVSIYSPNLMWEIPTRSVKPKRQVRGVDPQLLQMNPMLALQAQSMMMQQQTSTMVDKAVAGLMEPWLNYTSRETPGGGLSGQSHRSILDALLTGRGVGAARPYVMPNGSRILTGCFHESPYNIILDPDFEKLDDCRWMAIKHTDPYYEVEERFELPAGSLKNKATIESSWANSELSTDDMSPANRMSGKTSDKIVWYEIFSKAGTGVRDTMVPDAIRQGLQEVAGKFAYIVLCPDVPYPLNCPTEKIRGGMTVDEVKQAFSWPIPFHDDSRWPVEFLDFHHDPKSCWPMAPLAPGLGELKLLNFLFSWLANRTWSSSRDFWAVAGPHVEHYREYLLNGDDQCIVPTPVGVDDVRKAVQVLTQPETRQDMENLIAFVSDMFDKRVALTPFMYGLNQNGTQNRTAEETLAKSRAVGARPEFMQKQVTEWHGRLAQAEAMVTHRFIRSKDVAPALGPLNASIWDMLIANMSWEDVIRQHNYTVEAASMQRPNRERDIANFQQFSGLFLPIIQGHAEQTGKYDALNAVLDKWGELHDEDMEQMHIQAMEPSPEQQATAQLQVEQLKAEVAKTQAETQAKQADAQATMAEAQNAPMMLQMQMQMEQMKMQNEAQKAQAEMLKQQAEMRKRELEMQAIQAKNAMAMQFEAAKHQQQIGHDQQKANQELAQKQVMGAVALQTAQAMSEQKIEAQKESAAVQLEAKKAAAAAAKKQKPNGGTAQQ